MHVRGRAKPYSPALVGSRESELAHSLLKNDSEIIKLGARGAMGTLRHAKEPTLPKLADSANTNFVREFVVRG
jgi:hypothetical protein